MYESLYNRVIEKRIKKDKFVKLRLIQKEYSNQLRIELVRLDHNFTITELDKLIEDIKDDVESYEYDKDKSNEINELKLEIELLKKQISQVPQVVNIPGKTPKPKQVIHDEIEEKYMSFLRTLTKDLKGDYYNISKRNLYEKYTNIVKDNPLSYYCFNRKISMCKCITDDRIRINKTDELYVEGKDNRVHSFKINIQLILQWLEQRNYEETVKLKETEGEYEKFFRLFLQYYIKYGGKTKRSSKAPTEPKNSYFWFMEENYNQVKLEFPNYNSAQVSSILGEKWNELKLNNPEKIEFYKNKYILDCERFEREMVEFDHANKQTIITIDKNKLYQIYVKFMISNKYVDIFSNVKFSRRIKDFSKTLNHLCKKDVTIIELCIENIKNLLSNV